MSECKHEAKDYDYSVGALCCLECGTYLNEEQDIKGPEFQKAGGVISVVGTSVSTLPGNRGSGSSRAATLARGHYKIQQIATSIGLTSHHIEQAQHLFLQAVQRQFTQGRKTQNVVASCLYIACRRKKEPLMLLDFAEKLGTDLHDLGGTYVKLMQTLNLSLPLLDPSLFIRRFANQLELQDETGDKTHEVAMTALKLVAQFKKDWMVVGRRPSGLCGAALMVAAKAHGFHRTQKEVTKAVRICDMTLRKRLREFANTPSGGLTFKQFLTQAENLQLTRGQDPPAFNRLRQKEQLLLQNGQGEAEKEARLAKEIATLLDDTDFTRVAQGLQPVTLLEHEQELEATGPEGDAALEGLDDDALRQFLLTPTAQEHKRRMWMAANQEWLSKQELKKATQAAQADKRKTATPRVKRAKKELPDGSSTDRTMAVLADRACPVNYAALNLLLNPTCFDNDTADNRGAAAAAATAAVEAVVR